MGKLKAPRMKMPPLKSPPIELAQTLVSPQAMIPFDRASTGAGEYTSTVSITYGKH